MATTPCTDEHIIQHTRQWVESVVVGCNFCPFAARELARNSIHYRVLRRDPDMDDTEQVLHALVEECVELDADAAIETSLLILPKGFNFFDDYLDLLSIADALLQEQGYEGVYQLASFHPDYCFAEQDDRDAANYTNRSPYPMLHLIREASMERALAAHPDPDAIPQRNVDYARAQGLAAMRAKLAACLQVETPADEDERP